MIKIATLEFIRYNETKWWHFRILHISIFKTKWFDRCLFKIDYAHSKYELEIFGIKIIKRKLLKTKKHD